MFRLRSMRMASVALVLGAFAVAPALTFNFINDGSMTAQGMAAIVAAGNRWSAIYNDAITLNLTVGFSGSGLGASTSAQQLVTTYTNTRNALVADALGADDAAATASMPLGSIGFLINRTAENGNSATPYLDNNGSANNTNMVFTRANGRAIGLWAAVDGNSDGTILFGNSASWDFNPLDGIGAAQGDFEGVAAHEIGHAMGFISGVDSLDGSPGQTENNYRLRILDSFRYSTRAAVTQRDFTADGISKFFSINGGVTNLGGFSEGMNFGDGAQASHWVDNPPSSTIGIMDPFFNLGQTLVISNLDRRAFDVIGYNMVPEPATMAVLGIGALALLRRRRKA